MKGLRFAQVAFKMSIRKICHSLTKRKGAQPSDNFDPMMALPFCLSKGENPTFPYAETPSRSTREIILPLHGKAATGGFSSRFEP